MNRTAAMTSVLLLLLVVFVPATNSQPNGNTGNSCGCHGGQDSSTAISIIGQPSSYTPGSTYSLSITVSSSVVSGDMGGFSMSTTAGTFSNPGVNAKLASGKVTHSTISARNWSVDWTAPVAGTGTVTISGAGNAVDGNSQPGQSGSGAANDAWNTYSIQIPEATSQNSAPTASNLQVTPAIPTVLTGLTLIYTYDDAEGDSESGTTIEWFRDGVSVPEVTDSHTVPGSILSRGETWSVTVIPSDGTNQGTPQTLGSIIISNAAPTADPAVIIPISPSQSDNLSVQYTFNDADLDSDSGTIISWYLDGVHIPELDNSSTVSRLYTRTGDQWTASVNPSDGFTIGSPSNVTVLIGSSNSAPSLVSLTLDPVSPISTADLHLTYIYNDVDGDDISFTEIEWSVNGVHAPEHDDSMTIDAFHTSKGEIWTVRVRATDGIDISPWTDSSPRTIMNAPPELLSFSLGPEDATTISQLGVEYTWSDPDGDPLGGVHVHWFLDGERIIDHEDLPTIASAHTMRGQDWQAEIVLEDSDGATSTDHAAPAPNHRSNILTIGNALPSIDFNISSSAIGQPDALNPLELNLEMEDFDGDLVVASISWIRDGFRVSSLDNESLVPIQWLTVGQTWVVIVIADDGQGEVVEMVTPELVIGNLPPIASFSGDENALVDSNTILDASDSIDSDGDIVAWFWTIGENTYSGKEIVYVFDSEPTSVNLTVLDSDGGQSSIERVVQATLGATIIDLSVTKGAELIQLEWEWSGEPTEFHVWRSSKMIQDRQDFASAVLIVTTNETTYLDSFQLAGDYYYTVTVDIAGVENQRIVSSNSDSLQLTTQDVILNQDETSNLASALVASWIIISLLITGFSFIFPRRP